jgi:hypothetical protein
MLSRLMRILLEELLRRLGKMKSARLRNYWKAVVLQNVKCLSSMRLLSWKPKGPTNASLPRSMQFGL